MVRCNGTTRWLRRFARIAEHPFGDGGELLIVISQRGEVRRDSFGVVSAFLPHVRETVSAGSETFKKEIKGNCVGPVF